MTITRKINLNQLPHQRSFILHNAILTIIQMNDRFRAGEAELPKPRSWFKKKPTALNYVRYSEEEMIRRATFDPVYFFSLMTSDRDRRISQVEEELHRDWKYNYYVQRNPR
jgi:hypothetical protein